MEQPNTPPTHLNENMKHKIAEIINGTKITKKQAKWLGVIEHHTDHPAFSTANMGLPKLSIDGRSFKALLRKGLVAETTEGLWIISTKGRAISKYGPAAEPEEQ